MGMCNREVVSASGGEGEMNDAPSTSSCDKLRYKLLTYLGRTSELGEIWGPRKGDERRRRRKTDDSRETAEMGEDGEEEGRRRRRRRRRREEGQPFVIWKMTIWCIRMRLLF